MKNYEGVRIFMCILIISYSESKKREFFESGIGYGQPLARYSSPYDHIGKYGYDYPAYYNTHNFGAYSGYGYGGYNPFSYQPPIIFGSYPQPEIFHREFPFNVPYPLYPPMNVPDISPPVIPIPTLIPSTTETPTVTSTPVVTTTKVSTTNVPPTTRSPPPVHENPDDHPQPPIIPNSSPTHLPIPNPLRPPTQPNPPTQIPVQPPTQTPHPNIPNYTPNYVPQQGYYPHGRYLPHFIPFNLYPDISTHGTTINHPLNNGKLDQIIHIVSHPADNAFNDRNAKHSAMVPSTNELRLKISPHNNGQFHIETSQTTIMGDQAIQKSSEQEEKNQQPLASASNHVPKATIRAPSPSPYSHTRQYNSVNNILGEEQVPVLPQIKSSRFSNSSISCINVTDTSLNNGLEIVYANERNDNNSLNIKAKNDTSIHSVEKNINVTHSSNLTTTYLPRANLTPFEYRTSLDELYKVVQKMSNEKLISDSPCDETEKVIENKSGETGLRETLDPLMHNSKYVVVIPLPHKHEKKNSASMQTLNSEVKSNAINLEHLISNNSAVITSKKPFIVYATSKTDIPAVYQKTRRNV